VQLYFIRHAQSANNKLYEETGSWDGRDSDPELTALGHQQARLLAEHLACANGEGPGRDFINRRGFGLTQLYTSLMVRAVATGVYLAEALGLPLQAWEDLHEVGGIFSIDTETGEHIGQPGRPRSEFAARFPQLELPATLGEDGWWNRSPESIDWQVRRARRFVYDLLERHGGTEDRVAVISHGGFYNYVLAELLGTQAENGFWFGINNTGITRLNFSSEGIGLAYANRLEHLPAELIT
jgi:2,3-bisphosphoglycerate-dependent phosphoglycerate mutase